MHKNRTSVPLIYTATMSPGRITLIDTFNILVEEASLPLTLMPIAADTKLTQKVRQQLSQDYATPILIMDDKQVLSLVTQGISVAPNWPSLQRRIVSAGRKTELILQATKLIEAQRVLDATAGFGHDSLILASTGAQVTLLERSPLLVLLLLFEQQRMSAHKHWQKLMTRLDIRWAEATSFMTAMPQPYDVVYLDPMFPDNSYEHANTAKGAKVGKHMQALHHITKPPDALEEEQLLELALTSMVTRAGTRAGGRVIVKRPINAPSFGKRLVNETWKNDVVRFDGYLS